MLLYDMDKKISNKYSNLSKVHEDKLLMIQI